MNPDIRQTEDMKITTASLARHIGMIVTLAFPAGNTVTGRVYKVADGNVTLTRYIGVCGRTAERITIPVDGIAACVRGTRWP